MTTTFYPAARSVILFTVLLLTVLTSIVPARAEPALPDSPADRQALAARLVEAVEERADSRTGLVLSYGGDASAIGRHGAQLYDTGLRLLADSRHGAEIIRTFAAANAGEGRPGLPQTLAAGFAPSTGIYSWIRIGGFTEPWWWNDWEWSVKTGENAWLGLGALHRFNRTGERQALQLAIDRAQFILALQDDDGGFRIGPRRLAEDFWWRRKSTENNESAVAFLDMLAAATGEGRYRAAADRAYAWLAEKMYDRDHHLLRRGEVEEAGGWRRDSLEDLAADTINWLPLARILGDRRFGADRQARLAEIKRMADAMVERCGVRQEGALRGISYSPLSRRQAVISLEWSAQYVLLCRRLAREHERDRDQVEAGIWHARAEEVLRSLAGYITVRDGEPIAAHAVFPDGTVAAGQPMWGDIILTPAASLSTASHLYLAFALRGIDPLRLAD